MSVVALDWYALYCAQDLVACADFNYPLSHRLPDEFVLGKVHLQCKVNFNLLRCPPPPIGQRCGRGDCADGEHGDDKG